MSNYGNSGKFDNFSQHYAITMPRNCTGIPEYWLFYEILDLGISRIRLDQIELFSQDGSKTCIREFVNEYQKTDTLIRYFVKPKIRDFHSKVFGDMKYLENSDYMKHEKYGNQAKLLQFDNVSQTSPNISSMDIASHKSNNDNTLGNNTESFSQPSLSPNSMNTHEELKLPPTVYRVGHSDEFACTNCKLRDDKWGMLNHFHYDGHGESKEGKGLGR
jgi:hypothetical protein